MPCRIAEGSYSWGRIDMSSKRLRTALASAGYEVIPCPGPAMEDDYTCDGDRQGYCPLVERADVVVLDPRLEGDRVETGTTAESLLELYTGRGRAVVLLGSNGSLVSPKGCILRAGDRQPGDVVAAVRSAPEADGYVLRDPDGER